MTIAIGALAPWFGAKRNMASQIVGQFGPALGGTADLFG